MNFAIKSPAQQHAAAADLCDNVIYYATYTADYDGNTIDCAHNVIACDHDDALRMARCQCKRDGGENIRNISARYIGRAK